MVIGASIAFQHRQSRHLSNMLVTDICRTVTGHNYFGPFMKCGLNCKPGPIPALPQPTYMGKKQWGYLVEVDEGLYLPIGK